jgi:hypothetical protein
MGSFGKNLVEPSDPGVDSEELTKRIRLKDGFVLNVAFYDHQLPMIRADFNAMPTRFNGSAIYRFSVRLNRQRTTLQVVILALRGLAGRSATSSTVCTSFLALIYFDGPNDALICNSLQL